MTTERCERCGAVMARSTRPLTRRQSEIYAYLESHEIEHGYAPSFDDIATRFNEARSIELLADLHEATA